MSADFDTICSRLRGTVIAPRCAKAGDAAMKVTVIRTQRWILPRRLSVDIRRPAGSLIMSRSDCVPRSSCGAPAGKASHGSRSAEFRGHGKMIRADAGQHAKIPEADVTRGEDVVDRHADRAERRPAGADAVALARVVKPPDV